MIALKKLITVGSIALIVMMMSSPSQSKGILEILRDKGVITEEEYQQALQEAKGKEDKVVKEAKAEAGKQSKLPDWLHRTSIFGDIRYRHEGFYNSELQANNPTRNRERIRARLGLGLDLSPELSGKLRLVTGDAGDPISTNQTLSELFTRKPINLDWAFITVSPWQSFGLDKLTGSEKPMVSVTAGKFPVPLFAPGNSELVFDGDLSPEGISEGITLWDRPGGFVRIFKINGLQWSIKELSNNSATQLFNAADAWMFGGQAQLQVAPTDNSKLTLSIGDYGFQRLDVIAREKNQNLLLQITNSVKLFDGTVVGGRPVSPTSCSSPFTAAGCIKGFDGGFNILNAGLQLDVPTPWKNFPLNFFADFAHNTQAATNDNSGYWLGFRIGQVKNKGDLRFTYNWAYTQTDAVPSVFSYSDFGKNGGTNVMGNIISLDYVLLPHLTLTAKNHFVNFIKVPAGFRNPTQSRVQLDMVLAF
jgi:Putative porin